MQCNLILCLVAALPLLAGGQEASQVRRLSLAQYRDRMEAGWLGQMVGVSWGAPTEFRWVGRIIPEDQMPAWQESWVNHAFGQDDLYVEMTFLRTLQVHGLDVSIRQAGIDFANSRYPLWCANYAGRENLRRGIAPPDSGHPAFSRHSDDIDYQIEADFAGLISPGLPNQVIALGEKFGRLMNYGDGLYGGQFMGGMYAEAFFTGHGSDHRLPSGEPPSPMAAELSAPVSPVDIERVIVAGLQCIPPGSQYAEMVRDVLVWHRENPDSWEQAWQRVNDKYLHNPAYRRYSSMQGESSIDAKLNGAYVLLGLLYGSGDIERTITIACRCGQDSDCNPSSAAGVLFTMLGLARVPDRYKVALDREATFAFSPYSFSALIEVCEALARKTVERAGGSLERDAGGNELFVIPVQEPRPGPLEQSWEPGPTVTGDPRVPARFTEQERRQIVEPDELTRALSVVAPGWELNDCGPDMGAPRLLEEFRGKRNVLITHPRDRNTGSVLSRKLALPADSHSHLQLTVGHHPQGDWLLLVRVNGQQVLSKTIGPQTASDGWVEVSVDLSGYAGKEMLLELVNQPTGWAWEAAYWARVVVEEN